MENIDDFPKNAGFILDFGIVFHKRYAWNTYAMLMSFLVNGDYLKYLRQKAMDSADQMNSSTSMSTTRPTTPGCTQPIWLVIDHGYHIIPLLY